MAILLLGISVYGFYLTPTADPYLGECERSFFNRTPNCSYTKSTLIPITDSHKQIPRAFWNEISDNQNNSSFGLIKAGRSIQAIATESKTDVRESVFDMEVSDDNKTVFVKRKDKTVTFNSRSTWNRLGQYIAIDPPGQHVIQSNRLYPINSTTIPTNESLDSFVSELNLENARSVSSNRALGISTDGALLAGEFSVSDLPLGDIPNIKGSRKSDTDSTEYRFVNWKNAEPFDEQAFYRSIDSVDPWTVIVGDNGMVLVAEAEGEPQPVKIPGITQFDFHDVALLNSDDQIQVVVVGIEETSQQGFPTLFLSNINRDDSETAANEQLITNWRQLSPFSSHPAYPFVSLAIGLPILIFSLFLFLYRRKRSYPKNPISAGVSDRPLDWTDNDVLGLRQRVIQLSDFLRNAETEPPLTIAVSGGWGSGKSSFMNLLHEDLHQRGNSVVWFNAWHYHTEEHRNTYWPHYSILLGDRLFHP